MFKWDVMPSRVMPRTVKFRIKTNSEHFGPTVTLNNVQKMQQEQLKITEKP